MKLLRPFSTLLVVLFIYVVSSLCVFALDTRVKTKPNGVSEVWLTAHDQSESLPFLAGNIPYDRFESFTPDMTVTIVKTPTDGGIKEEYSAKYRDRFEKWKAELRSTEFGRQQWDNYANNKQFLLTISISGDRSKGAGTDKFLWDEEGNFVGATITLGADIDQGYPNPIYYPVLNSLSSEETPYAISGRILAATKMAHEIGHVNQAAKANMKFLQLQNKLMPEYNSIFLKNGLKTNDKKLVDLQQQMGGTPVEIWESREYWSEVNAMLYLKQRISKEEFYCYVFNRIKSNLETYAREYEKRFGERPEFSSTPCWK